MNRDVVKLNLIVFVDTPGIHKAKNKLGEYMVHVAERSLNEVDVVLWLVEPSTFIGAGERHILDQLKKVKTPVILEDAGHPGDQQDRYGEERGTAPGHRYIPEGV